MAHNEYNGGPGPFLTSLVYPVVLLFLTVSFCASSTVAGASPTAFSSAYGGYGRNLRAADNASLSADWMSRLPDATRVFLDMSLPGTHNSGSYRFSDGNLAQCQTATVLRQLEAGIRFLDLRLACMAGVVRVAHGYLPSTDNTPTLADVAGQIRTFLSAHPTEVVVARVSREKVVPWYPWSSSLVETAFNMYFPARTVRDADCADGNQCTLGALRGKVVFLAKSFPVSALHFLDYNTVLPFRQDDFEFDRITYLYTKWRNILSYMTRAASPTHAGSGFIHYLSGSQKADDLDPRDLVLPYHVASGQVSYHEGGPLRLVGGAPESALTPGICSGMGPQASVLYPDFPRVNCHGCDEETTCAVAYQGTNRLFLAWLRAGLRGEPQSHDYPYVFPKRLGIVAMDFPDNAVIDAIVATNFATEPASAVSAAAQVGTSTPDGRKVFSCARRFCGSGVAADAPVYTGNRGVVAARNLVVGDLVQGQHSDLGTQTSCTVLGVFVTDDTGSVVTLDNVTRTSVVAVQVEQASEDDSVDTGSADDGSDTWGTSSNGQTSDSSDATFPSSQPAFSVSASSAASSVPPDLSDTTEGGEDTDSRSQDTVQASFDLSTPEGASSSSSTGHPHYSSNESSKDLLFGTNATSMSKDSKDVTTSSLSSPAAELPWASASSSLTTQTAVEAATPVPDWQQPPASLPVRVHGEAASPEVSLPHEERTHISSTTVLLALDGELSAPSHGSPNAKGEINISDLYVYDSVAVPSAEARQPVGIVNVVTECPLINLFTPSPVSSARWLEERRTVLHTPLSTIFCGAENNNTGEDGVVMSAAQYFRVHEAMMRVVRRTGLWWFDPTAYVEVNAPEVSSGGSGGGAQPEWVRAAIAEAAQELEPMHSPSAVAGLPRICSSLLACQASKRACRCGACTAFEEAAAQHIRAHVNWPMYGRSIEEAYPYLGDAEAPYGNLLHDVLP